MSKNHYQKLRKNSPFLLTAEHASARIPREYARLGLDQECRQGAKDLFDPGSLAVLRILENKLAASYLYSNISRLVVDYNRVLDGRNKKQNTFHSGAMKKELLVEKNGQEKVVTIPANSFSDEQDFSSEERKRYMKYVIEYREDGIRMLSRIKDKHKKAIIISIHSFFPIYNGDKRKVDIGVLYDKSQKIGKQIVMSLQKNTKLNIGDNAPWKMSDVDGGIFGHLQGRNVELVAFDINNKHLKSQNDIEKISKLIYQAIKNL
ncbi:MAG: N-formylglutamate amidohydrolase [Parcubacteria group bacterium]